MLRPALSVDYYRLDEQAHSESGGGSAFDLSIDSRKSDELAANGTLTVGCRMGGAEGWTRLELEGGGANCSPAASARPSRISPTATISR